MTSQPLRVETATANQIPLSASKAVSQAHHDALWIARDRLLAELSPQERGMFTDCETWEDVIKSIQLSPAYQKHSRSQLRRMLGPIERFSRGLAPFFDVISILVSARPEWAAVFWGSLRLVLTLASNYLSYFAKIGKLLEDLLKELPRFREIHNIISVKGEAMGETNDQKSGFKRYDQSTNKIGLGHYMVEVETPKDPKIAVNESQDPTKPGISISSSSTQANRSSDDRLFESDAEIPRRLHPMAEASRSRISDSIISIYQNIMAMLQELVKVFAHQNGTPKSSLRVLCGTIWRSFDERVMDWTEEIRKQKAFLVDEMAVIEFRLTIEAYGERRSERELHFRAEREADAKSRSKSTRKRKERIRTKARVWIAPPEFAEEHEQASEARVEGTTEWFGDHDQISRWRTDELDPTVGTILWVHGNAGTGKTTLAAALIDELREEAGITVLYFYFTQTSSCKKRTSDSALRSILAQIVQQHPDSEPLLDALALTMSDRFGGQLKATFRELLELAQLVLSTILENTRIVLDGIDECEDFDQLLPMISFLADQNSPVKFLLLSRPGVQSLLKMVDEDDCMNLNDPMISEYTRHDIRHYLAREVSSMIAHGELSIIDYSAASYVDKLALGSNGMFLWARLAIRLLQSPALTLGQKKEIVQSIVLPEGLEKIYDRMLERMSTRSVTVQDLARKLLVLLTYGILGDFPLRFSEDMLSYKLKGPDSKFANLRETLLVSCGGFIEIRNARRTRIEEDCRVSFIHLSAKEYLMSISMSASSCGLRFFDFPDPGSGHLRITLLCLDYLDSTMPRLPICNGRDSETAAIRDGLEKGRPFMKYALAYWPHHLSSIVKAIRPIARWQGLRDSLIRYLGNQFMLLAGIEAHYLLGVKLPVVTQHLFSFADCIISGHMESESIHVPKDIKILAGNLADFGRDLLQIEAIWGERLCQQPYLIWHDVTAFIDCHFLRPTRATTVSHLMPELHDESFSSRPISSKSVLSLDGQRIAILSVWSSREFECEYRRSVASPGRNYKLDTFESFKPLCKGWKATYKIKTTQLPLLTVHSVELDIAPSDIWCRVLEGLRPNQASGSDFTFSIPLSIARKDLRTFSIMYNVLRLKEHDAHASAGSSSGYCRVVRPAVPLSNSTAGGDVITTNSAYSKYLPQRSSCIAYFLWASFEYAIIFDHNDNFVGYRDSFVTAVYPLTFQQSGTHSCGLLSPIATAARGSASLSQAGNTFAPAIAAGVTTGPFVPFFSPSSELFFNAVFCFHPHLHVVCHKEGDCTYIWRFGEDPDGSSRFVLEDLLPGIVHLLPGILPDELSNLTFAIETVTFSECGTYLILSIQSQEKNLYSGLPAAKTTFEVLINLPTLSYQWIPPGVLTSSMDVMDPSSGQSHQRYVGWRHPTSSNAPQFANMSTTQSAALLSGSEPSLHISLSPSPSTDSSFSSEQGCAIIRSDESLINRQIHMRKPYHRCPAPGTAHHLGVDLKHVGVQLSDAPRPPIDLVAIPSDSGYFQKRDDINIVDRGTHVMIVLNRNQRAFTSHEGSGTCERLPAIVQKDKRAIQLENMNWNGDPSADVKRTTQVRRILEGQSDEQFRARETILGFESGLDSGKHPPIRTPYLNIAEVLSAAF